MADETDQPVEDVTSSPPGPMLVKLVPPRLPPWLVERPPLERRLDEATGYRLTVVVAGAGFGKSTQLGARALANRWAWYTIDRTDRSPLTLGQGVLAAVRRRLPELPPPLLPVSAGGDEDASADGLASLLVHSLEEELSEDLVLVLDDVHELDGAPSAMRFVESLVRYAPAELHLVLSSRHELPFSIVRMRGRGEVLDIVSADLAFSPEETSIRLSSALPTVAPELAGSVHDASEGWPAAVQLAAEMLAADRGGDHSRLLEALASRAGPLYSYLAEEVFSRESHETVELVRTAAQFDRFTPELCSAVGLGRVEETLAELARRGLVTAPPPGTDDWYTLHALVREFVLETWPLANADIRALRRRAARWFESVGRYREALESLTSAADASGIVRLIRRRWRELTDQAALDALVQAGAVLPVALRPQVAITVAHAHTLRGEFDRALEWLADQREEGDDDPDLLFQIALVHINRDEPAHALEVLLRIGGPADGRGRHWAEGKAMTRAFIAYQLMALGRLDEARSYAARAYEVARGLPEVLTPLAEAHMALGDVAHEDGDLADAAAHYDAAVEIAQRLGNVLATCSARNRRSQLRVQLGLLTEAIDDATHGLTLADRVGFSLFQAWSPTARGFAHLAVGRLDEAAADFSTGREVQERLGSSAVSIPLTGLGDVHRARGEPTQARSCYERALAAADRSGNVLDQVFALAGLACTLADEDPVEAERAAARAVELSFGSCVAPALVASGWIALHRGNRDAARSAADAALTDARRRGAPGLIAEALELRALCEPEPDLEKLEEAHGICTQIGAQLGEARTALALARLAGNEQDASRAEAALRQLGVRQTGTGAGLLQMIGPHATNPLAVHTLGHFAVLRDGRRVATSEWQSKKARDLLKILVTHRGQSVARDWLMEALWPDEDPRKTSNRLSVALNVVRGVLDPERRLEQDHYISSEGDAIRLVLAHVRVDLEEFLSAATAGINAYREDLAGCDALLEQAESRYGGDFLEEDRYEDWAVLLRDEARATYLEILRALAAIERSRDGASTRYHLRALSLDPYDEDTYLALVSMLMDGGRHGEARRAYRQYVTRMREIEVEPAPFPTSGTHRALSRPNRALSEP